MYHINEYHYSFYFRIFLKPVHVNLLITPYEFIYNDSSNVCSF